MGQIVNVVERPSARKGIVRFDTNRALSGMGHERYVAGEPIEDDRPVDEIARRIFARGGVHAVHVNGGVITVDLQKGFGSEGIADIIRGLYTFYLDPGEELPEGDPRAVVLARNLQLQADFEAAEAKAAEAKAAEEAEAAEAAPAESNDPAEAAEAQGDAESNEPAEAAAGAPTEQAEAGEVEAGKVEAGKVEEGKVEEGKVEEGKVEEGKVEEGKVEADDAGKVEAGKVEAGKVEADDAGKPAATTSASEGHGEIVADPAEAPKEADADDAPAAG